VKLFGAAPEGMKGRYSPAECIGIRRGFRLQWLPALATCFEK
jgi:hypothetical protein